MLCAKVSILRDDPVKLEPNKFFVNIFKEKVLLEKPFRLIGLQIFSPVQHLIVSTRSESELRITSIANIFCSFPSALEIAGAIEF